MPPTKMFFYGSQDSGVDVMLSSTQTSIARLDEAFGYEDHLHCHLVSTNFDDTLCLAMLSSLMITNLCFYLIFFVISSHPMLLVYIFSDCFDFFHINLIFYSCISNLNY